MTRVAARWSSSSARTAAASVLAVAAAAVALVGGAGEARAQGAEDATKQACVSAYDETQTLRQSGSLSSAREKALACSQEQCPAIVKKDCAQWLGEIDNALPRVSFGVKDATGQDTTAARVFMDGKPLLEKVEANAVAVDPGERTFRAEIDGQAPQEQKVILREGEKNRVIVFSFVSAPTPGGGPGTTEYRGEPEGGGGIPTASWVLGGVGVVGIGLFATFGALGLSEKSDAEDPAAGCAPNCSDEDVSSIRTKFLVADITLGVGLAALGAAVIVAVVSGGGGEIASAPGALQIGAAPTLSGDGVQGGVGAVSGSF